MRHGTQQRFRVVDAHVHVFNSSVQGANDIPRYYPDSTIEMQIEKMDQGGVGKAFLISYSAEDVSAEIRRRGQSPIVLKPVASKQYQFRSWKKHRDRFWGFTDHVSPIRETYLEDLARDLDEGASGVKLLPIFHGLLADHPGWLPVYELCRKRRKPIILDLSWWYFGQYELVNESAERRKLASTFRTFAEYVALLDPFFEKFPDIPISLAHCGTARNKYDYPDIFAFLQRHPNISCDVGMISDYNPAFLEQLIKATGASRVMYGTDAPYWFKGLNSYRDGRFRWPVIADECTSLNDHQKQMILAGNAECFVRFELPQRSGET
jgi:predicted TIM-barrel fold metal-dependent hydrolase